MSLALFFIAWLFTYDATASPCPAGAEMVGRPPPDGLEYACVSYAKPERPARHGWSVRFNESGLKVEECEYRNGVRYGRCTLYDEEGTRVERGYWRSGRRVREGWFWTLPHEDSEERYVLNAATAGDEATELRDRREQVELFFKSYGAADGDATALAGYILAYVDQETDERRVVCSTSLCAGPGRDGEPIYVREESTDAEVERDRDLVLSWANAAREDNERETKLAAAELRRKVKTYKAAVSRYRKLERQWGHTHLKCNDGTRSPSCLCSYGSARGCCSHHGGVWGCPRDHPEAPVPPDGVANEIR